jgi:hypothetical protein
MPSGAWSSASRTTGSEPSPATWPSRTSANAFNQERAAQSLFHVVTCCSGPFAAYRRSVIDRVKDRYVSQTFLGESCTYGDDRHLTNLVLAEGYRVCFDGRAEAHTAAPTRIGIFLRQQIRWNKSFFRELRWTLPFAHRRHPYLAYDLACQTLLPPLLITTATLTVLETASKGAHVGLRYLGTILAIGLLRSLYGAARTRDPGFTSFAVYGLVHMLLLKPISLYSLATLGTTHWGTRDTEPEAASDDSAGVLLPANAFSERFDTAPGGVPADAIASSILRRRSDQGLLAQASDVVAGKAALPYVSLSA